VTAASATPRPRNAPTRWIAWAAIVLGVVYLIVGGGGGNLGIYFLLLRVLSVTVLVAALAIWLVAGVRDPFWRPRTALAPAILAGLAALSISDVASEQPRLGADYVAYAVLLAAGYLLLQRLFAHPFFGPRLGMLSVLLCVGVSAIYVAAVVNAWIALWSSLGRIVTPPLRPFQAFLVYGNPNPIATVIVLLWVASVVHIGVATRRARLAVGALSLLVAIAVFLTGSRGAWVSVAAASAVVALAWLASAWRGGAAATGLRSVAAAVRSPRARIGVLAAVIVVGILLVVLSPGIIRRLTDNPTDARLVFLTTSVRMFESKPLTGVGPGMWVVDRLRFIDPAAGDQYVPHAHNIVSQTLAELGLLGIAAGLVLAAALALLVIRGMRSSNPLTRRLAWGGLFASIYFLGAQMTDFFANLPAVGFCYALTIARLDARVSGDSPVEPQRTRRRPWLAAVTAGVIAVGILGATLWLARSEEAAWHAEQAVRSANEGQWTDALAAARRASDHDPGMPPYLFTLGLAEAKTGDTNAALVHLRESAKIDDYPTTWLDVARLELDQGHTAEARQAVAAAMRIGYEEPKVAIGAVTLDLELGDRAAAVGALTSALVFAPGLASDPYWSTGSRSPILSEAVTSALTATDPSIAYKIALEAGRLEDAATLVATIAPDERAVPDLVVRAWGGDRAAFDQLHELAVADPLTGETGTLCRRVADHSTEPGWTGDALICDGTGRRGAIIVVRVDPPSSWWGILPGPNAYQHWAFGYRRFAPGDDLVPGLPHVGSEFT
jgi:O-antigen ligase